VKSNKLLRTTGGGLIGATWKLLECKDLNVVHYNNNKVEVL
jgi:hypothetical protein